MKEAERKEKKQARDAILKKAEADYNWRKAKDETARLRGDDKWMLPSVEARINAKTKNVKKTKHKKKKKKAKRKTSSGSDSGDESSEEEWVEKVVCTSEETSARETCKKAGTSHSGPNQDEYRPKNDVSPEKQEESEGPPRRDEWMTLPGLFPCVSREQLKQHSGQLSKAEEQRQKNRYLLDTLGQTDRELNPYWRDGGTGLPQEKKAEGLGNRKSRTLPVKSVGDHGVDWLQRALKHTNEQAANEGRSVEEVAAERWGNLEKLETMLAEAERKNRKHGSGTEYEKNKHEERSVWRKDKYNTESTRRAVGRLDTKSCDDQKHSDGTQHGRNHTASRFFQTPGTDGDIQYRKRDKQDGHPLSRSRYSEMSWKFHKPKKETDMPGREYTSRQDFARDEVDSVSAPSSCKNPVASGNWRKKESESLRPPDSPTSMKSSSCKEMKPYTKTVSSSASSDSEAEKEETAEAQHLLTDKEMNDLGAKLVKAEILGNETLAKELKRKLDAARAMKGTKKKDTPAAKEEETVILTRTDSRGFVRPLQKFGQHAEPVGGRRRKQKIETHAEGKRMRYYADDDRHSLQDLFEREKLGTVEDQNEVFSRLASKGAGRTGSEYDMDDIFAQQAQLKESDGRVQSRERGKAIREHRMVNKVLENCRWCFDSKNMLKHLIVAIGSKVYLCLPPYQSLTEGHCLIIPMYHTPCATQLDEDVWSEMQTFRKTLTSMFREKLDLDVVFFETAMYLRKFPHMVMECVPMPRESSDLAPIYFKKAILECETEWATNKKLVDLSGKDVRRAVPKGLPYFAVDFGLDPGFAHVIEDEKMFSKNFAQEIIGGMLDLDHSLWRKQRQENFDLQRKKVLKFAEWWKTYDFTVRKEKDSSDSDGTSFGT